MENKNGQIKIYSNGEVYVFGIENAKTCPLCGVVVDKYNFPHIVGGKYCDMSRIKKSVGKGRND